MKKTLLTVSVVALSLLLAASAFAQSGQAARNTGCGLGTVLWGNQADDATMFQAIQATTNATFGNQTFGITFGTLGCERPARFVSNERTFEFASANMDLLARDIAFGGGESLETLAELMEVPAEQRPVFFSRLQDNFARIFLTGEENSAVLLERIEVAAN